MENAYAWNKRSWYSTLFADKKEKFNKRWKEVCIHKKLLENQTSEGLQLGELEIESNIFYLSTILNIKIQV